MKLKRWYPELIGLIAAAFATRIWALLTPNAVVFDEVYFKAFAGHYLDGHYFFDIHPPLGKLLLAGWAHILHLTSSDLLNGTAVQLRFLPAIAGALLVPVVWGILRRLGASRPFAFIGALLILADNALTVESRFILVDSMLLLFGLSAVYFYLVARKSAGGKRWLWLALAAAGAGAAASTKWTGLNALAIIGLMWIWDQRSSMAGILKRAGELALLVFLPIVIYMTAFWVHFALLPSSGDGDAFMSPSFQSTLKGNPAYDPTVHLSFFNKFTQLNAEMLKANQTLTATHPYGSKWYSWPLELRPIYYWAGDTAANGQQGNIYLLGNPIVWWGIWLSIIVGVAYSLRYNRKLKPRTIGALTLCVAAYLINLVPFIGVTRVMFLYHYLFSFIFSIIFAVMLWNDLASEPKRQGRWTKNQRVGFGLVIAAVVIGFIYFAPLTYGTPLSPAGLQSRMWLPSWR